jgi:head-tail adaptor
MDSDEEEWVEMWKLHAIQVNRAGGGEAYSAGREQFRPRLTFEFRWSKRLEELRYDTQNHRIIYQGQKFNIVDYDDYMEEHRTVRLTGEAYG